MTESFRSRVARELAGVLANRQPGKGDPCDPGQAQLPPDDPGYFASRSSKQLRLAEQAVTPEVREAHLKLAELHQAKARQPMTKAMQSGCQPDLELLRVDFRRDLDDLLGQDAADRFRMLKVKKRKIQRR
jgi:hypothetical protein